VTLINECTLPRGPAMAKGDLQEDSGPRATARAGSPWLGRRRRSVDGPVAAQTGVGSRRSKSRKECSGEGRLGKFGEPDPSAPIVESECSIVAQVMDELAARDGPRGVTCVTASAVGMG